MLLPRSLADDKTLLNISDEIWINVLRKDDNTYLNIDGKMLNYSNVPVGGTSVGKGIELSIPRPYPNPACSIPLPLPQPC